MIAILSPAMNMQQAGAKGQPVTTPQFLQDAQHLVSQLCQYDPWELESLLNVNPALALKAWEAYHSFDASRPGSPAVLSFYGLAYQNLEPEDFSPDDFTYAAGHLRLLSSLYGLLRPMDGIHPYRLDFACRYGKRKTDGKNLYGYWGGRVAEALYRETNTVVNLCSGEYTKLVAPHLTHGQRFVGFRFLVSRGGKLKCLATASKMARGQMARFIIKNRIGIPEELARFDWDGFTYAPRASSPDFMTFIQS